MARFLNPNRSSSLFSYLLRCQTCVFLEISAEETHIREAVCPCNLFYAQMTAVKCHFDLQYDILVYDVFGCVACYLTYYVSEIFGCDVHQLCIVGHISACLVVALH